MMSFAVGSPDMRDAPAPINQEKAEGRCANRLTNSPKVMYKIVERGTGLRQRICNPVQKLLLTDHPPVVSIRAMRPVSYTHLTLPTIYSV